MKNTLKAQANDVIICQGRIVIINSIDYQYYNDYMNSWEIEGYDQNNNYFIWKQYYDHGDIYLKENNTVYTVGYYDENDKHAYINIPALSRKHARFIFNNAMRKNGYIARVIKPLKD